MKKNNNKGFTLAELLIVVAIIAVLAAISIPVFNNQLEKSRQATDLANLRAAYAEAMVAALDSQNGTGEAVSEAMTQKTSTSAFNKLASGTTVGGEKLPESVTKGAKIKVTVTTETEGDVDKTVVTFGTP